MSLSDWKAKTKATTTSKNFYLPGEKVKVIIWDKVIPNETKKLHDDLKQLNGKGGSPKIVGLGFKIAVIERKCDDNWENGIKMIENNTLPSISISGLISMIPPVLYAKNEFWYSYAFGMNENGEKEMILPSASKKIFETKWVNKKKVNKTKTEIENELKAREEKLEALIKDFSIASEEEAEDFLMDRLIKKYGIGNIDKQGNMEFINAEVGVVFNTFIKPTRPPYFQISPFYLDKIKVGENSDIDKEYIVIPEARKNKVTIELASTIKELFTQNKVAKDVREPEEEIF